MWTPNEWVSVCTDDFISLASLWRDDCPLDVEKRWIMVILLLQLLHWLRFAIANKFPKQFLWNKSFYLVLSLSILVFVFAILFRFPYLELSWRLHSREWCDVRVSISPIPLVYKSVNFVFRTFNMKRKKNLSILNWLENPIVLFVLIQRKTQ